MDLHLTGKSAVVTGASRGIGLATARALLAEGATVVGVARSATDETTALRHVRAGSPPSPTPTGCARTS